MNVLYLEDDPSNAQLVIQALQVSSPGIRLDHVGSLADGFERLETELPFNYDIVLVDLSLTDGSGLELLAHIRRHNLPLAVVILTGSGNEEAVSAAIRAGADDYVTKRGDFLAKLPAILTDAVAGFREQATRRSRTIRVLYAESDVHDSGATLREIIRLTPHIHLEVVHHADAVLRILEAPSVGNAPDVLLLDHLLSGLNGTDLLREICQVRKLDLPVILLTGHRDEEVAVLAVRLGAADCILKAGNYLHRLPSIIENAWLGAEFKRQATALEEERARMAGIIDSAMDAMITVDEKQAIVLFNHAAERVFGCPAHQALGQLLAIFIPERLRGKHQNFAENPAGGRNVGHAMALTGLRANGEEFPMEASISRVVVGGQKLLTVILRDISRRFRAEEASLVSANFIKDVINSLASNVVVLDATGKIIAVNEAWKQFAAGNHPENDPAFDLGKNYLTDCVPYLHRETPDLANSAAEGIAAVIAGHRSFYGVEYPCPTLTEERWFIMRVSPLTGSQGAVVVHTNITERKQLERQFRQSQKMEAIGQLSSGVAHDFNNILTVVQMHASLLEMDESLSDAQRHSASEVGRAADRAAGLTRQLLAFGRRQTMQPLHLDLNETVAGMTSMLERIVGEDIEVQLHYSPKPLIIHADSGMMEQILLNLVVNARDAMPKGGRIIITTSSVQLEQLSTVQNGQPRRGSFVRISVRDTGLGIDPETLHRIFEPFFTTKEMGKGTGLGLATVYGIVQQHNGWIDVDSAPGEGSTFTFYLPEVRPLAKTKVVAVDPPVVSGGEETILVAEDEPNLRMVVRITLSDLGYRIIEASTGREALRLWKEHRDEIDLLFTDLVMPDGMNGRELAEQVLQDDPMMKVIYTSGYSSEVAGDELKLYEGINFVGKPFHPEKLAKIIRKRLDSSDSVRQASPTLSTVP